MTVPTPFYPENSASSRRPDRQPNAVRSCTRHNMKVQIYLYKRLHTTAISLKLKIQITREYLRTDLIICQIFNNM